MNGCPKCHHQRSYQYERKRPMFSGLGVVLTFLVFCVSGASIFLHPLISIAVFIFGAVFVNAVQPKKVYFWCTVCGHSGRVGE